MFRDITPAWTIFKTPLGPCGLSWTRRGFDHLVAPEECAVAIRETLEAACPGREETKRPDEAVRVVVERLQKHMGGKSDDLRDVKLDLSGFSSFGARVARALRRVPPGEVLTYGDLAKKAGAPGAARAVGRVMAANPLPLLVPCHRVLPAGGGLGGYSAKGGVALKARLLHAEGYVFSARLQAGLDHLSRVDRKLGRMIARSGPYLPAFGDREDPYEILVLSMVHQQISMKAATTIAGRVRALTPGDDFPTPQEFASLKDETLRGAGLSRQKIGYLRDLAARVDDGRLDLRALRRLDDAAAIAALVQVKGIGVWTAQMALIFHLDRLDVWPVDDLGLQDAVQSHLKLDARPTAKEMHVHGALWAPYRSMASWYLWRMVDGGGV
ncbi:methylated-DNA--[protein]-cysteine S-methyltransferase [bacterium]|nr:methylated-DNA--[protein]-cysteine S-methyltransferase [bacterium]